MKKTKDFNNILDECLERLLIRGETLEQCLASYPEQAVELKPLLETALLTKRASAIQPHPEFRARARYQFRIALQGIKPKRGFFPLTWPRWATVVAVVFVLLLAGGSTVAAASNSMPDGFLYPVKLATEQAQLTFIPSNISKAELYAKLADRRVAEIVYVANRGKPEQLEQTTQRLDTCLAMITSLARAQAREETEVLAPAPLPRTPAEAGQEELDYPRDKRLARLRMAVARYAINHPEALRAMLKTAPESARPALHRAIAIAEARYQQALEAVAD